MDQSYSWGAVSSVFLQVFLFYILYMLLNIMCMHDVVRFPDEVTNMGANCEVKNMGANCFGQQPVEPRKKKRPYFPLKPGCLIAILIIVQSLH